MIESLIEHARKLPDQAAVGSGPLISTLPKRPEAMFIACSDARVVPTFITGARPGQLFELRNVGNVVPPYRPRRPCGEAATIEYAVEIMRVTDIVICGHSDCGAVRALQPGGLRMTAFSTWWWLTRMNKRRLQQPGGGTGTGPDTAPDPGHAHLLAQLDKLGRYPKISRRVAAGQLRLHGWYYDPATRAVQVLRPDTEEFTPL